MGELAEGEKIIGAFDYGITVTNMRVMRDVAVTVFDGEKKLKRVAEGQEYYDFPIDKVSGVYHAEVHRRRKGLLYLGIGLCLFGFPLTFMSCMFTSGMTAEQIGRNVSGLVFGLLAAIAGVAFLIMYFGGEPRYRVVEKLCVHSGGVSFTLLTVSWKRGEGLKLRPIAEEIGRIMCVVRRAG